MKINIKIPTKGVAAAHPPAYATPGAAGIDLRATECCFLPPQTVTAIHTGVFVEFPEGVAGLLLPRSGLGTKGIVLANTVGLIDSDYRGEIIVMAYNRNPRESTKFKVNEGDRVAQLVFFSPIQADLQVVSEINTTARGEGGFGSTGN